jgi:Dolichyl-phosphate-mannose-protein mannosyltransferase
MMLPQSEGEISSAAVHVHSRRRLLIEIGLIFICSYLVLLLGMSRRPIVYDEGLVLTGAMRVAAGQIPHRDFYANYGPAEFYILAGLFRTFGESLLAERLFDYLLKALIVASVFAVASEYCRKAIAVFTAILAGAWLFGSGSGSTIIPVSLFNVIASALIVPVFARNVSIGRMLTAGAVAGVALLFRYDTGVALFGIHAILVFAAIYLRNRHRALHNFALAFWPYMLGFALVVLPPAFYYLSVAPIQPLLHDVVIYPSRYYHRARNLPFPGIHLISLENLEIYLPIVVVFIALCVALSRRFLRGQGDLPASQMISRERAWRGLLLTFSVLSLVMYFKGLVRVGIAQMYLSFLPSFLLLAVLLQQRSILPRLVRIFVFCLAGLSVTAATWSVLHAIKLLHTQHLSVPEYAFSSHQGSDTDEAWCHSHGPLTKGFCFLPEESRIQTIEFIEDHTQPGQTLYVGLPKHDRVFVNDNIMYFATQRLPATRWSHFDPLLQNRYDIQAQMVHELADNKPPYVVIDSEWDALREPNDSSVSSGVTLLDDYIRSHYESIRKIDQFSIWQRIH